MSKLETITVIRRSRTEHLREIHKELSELKWYQFLRRAWLKKLIRILKEEPVLNDMWGK